MDLDEDGLDNCEDFDSDGDGLNDQIESQLSNVAASQSGEPIDSDQDGDPDYLDTDSDNDSISDTDEAFDINGDGRADIIAINQDVDRNGLDDAYDEAGDIEFVDTDENGIPNWRDDDDDGDGIRTIDEINAQRIKHELYLPFISH